MNILEQGGKCLYIWKPNGPRPRLHMHTYKRKKGPSNEDKLLAEKFMQAISSATGVQGDIRENTDRCNLLWEHEKVFTATYWLLNQSEFVSNLTEARLAALQSYIDIQINSEREASRIARETLCFILDDGRELTSQASRVGFLADRNGFSCIYCKTPLEEPEIDHLVPYSWTCANSQSSDPGDFVLSCSQCNKAKSARTEVEYMASSGDKVAKFVLGIQ